MGKRYLLVSLDSRLANRYRLPFRIHWMGPMPILSCQLLEVRHHTGRKGDGVVHHWSTQQRTQPQSLKNRGIPVATHWPWSWSALGEFTKWLNFFRSVVFSQRICTRFCSFTVFYVTFSVFWVRGGALGKAWLSMSLGSPTPLEESPPS